MRHFLLSLTSSLTTIPATPRELGPTLLRPIPIRERRSLSLGALASPVLVLLGR